MTVRCCSMCVCLSWPFTVQNPGIFTAQVKTNQHHIVVRNWWWGGREDTRVMGTSFSTAMDFSDNEDASFFLLLS